MEGTVQFKGWTCNVVKHTYSNGRPALQLYAVDDGIAVAKATVNVPEIVIPDTLVLIKDWAENEGILNVLVSEGIVKDTGHQIQCGYVYANVCELLI